MTPTAASAYWDAVLAEWVSTSEGEVWRDYCDVLNRRLLGAWLDLPQGARILKTDLFEEAVGEGLVPALLERGLTVTGIDVSAVAVGAAAERHGGLDAVVADVKALPFADGSFDAVVSTSTLDHFDSLAEIDVALKELARVLVPGGDLVITIDNAANPAIALRAIVPYQVLCRLRLVPYRAGKTCGPRRLRALLEAAGFEVLDTRSVMHAPRVAAVRVARRMATRDAGARARFGRLLLALEALGALPTRWLTGYYAAVHARKR